MTFGPWILDHHFGPDGDPPAKRRFDEDDQPVAIVCYEHDWHTVAWFWGATIVKCRVCGISPPENRASEPAA